MRLGLFVTGIPAAFVTTSAQAALTAEWVRAISGPGAPADTQTWDLMITFDTGDWASAGLNFMLPDGATFYNDTLGGDTKPDPALVAAFPSVAYDTYVTGPADTGTVGGTAPLILGGYPGGPAMVGQGSQFSVGWGDLVTNSPGTYAIARITFPLSTANFAIQGEISTIGLGGHTIAAPPGPEPASLGLAALMVTGLLERPRRRSRCAE